MKISTQFLLSVLVLSGVAVYFLADFVISDLKPRYREEVEENLADSANIFAALLAQQSTTDTPSVELLRQIFAQTAAVKLDAQIYDLRKLSVDLRVYVTDAKGIVLFDSFNSSNVGKDFSNWRDVSLSLRSEYGARSTRDDASDPRSSVLYVSAPVKRDGRIIGTVSAAKPTSSVNFFMERAKRKILQISIIEAIAIVLLSMLMVIFVTLPVRRLTAYARAIRDGRPAVLPSIRSTDLNELAMAFEEMKNALAGKEYVEQYVQTLTHELKSPLAAIRGSAELLGEEQLPRDKQQLFSANIYSESVRLQAIIDKLLELAAVEKLDFLQNARKLDVLPLFVEAIDALSPRFEAKKLVVEWDEKSSVVLVGDDFLLAQALRNILDNAIDFSPPGATIRCSCGTRSNTAEIRVRDFGSGVPRYASAKVFDRFFSLPRPDSGKKSSGLGLSFVREVVLLHNGTIELEDADPGTNVKIVLPL